MSQIQRTYAAIGDFDAATRSFPVIASTRNPVKASYFDADGKAATRLESLESWDLRRFIKNPIILAVHDQGCIGSIIGEAKPEEILQTERGLEMRIYLASAHDAPAVVDIENKLKSKLLRGISVGFTYGTEAKRGTVDGLPYSSFADNELSEVSLVPVPADADALVDTPETRAAKGEDGTRGLGCMEPADEDKRKATASQAGKTLAAARQPAQQKLDFNDVEHHYDRLGGFGDVERTQVGGIRVPARLTRTGILKYILPDGTVSRQLRLPEEVFDAASLATLRSAPVVAHKHHTRAAGLVDATNFRDRALGHVEDPRAAGQYVEGTLVVNDADTADAIERRELSDISCGYTCKHDHTPGTYDGEPYDLIHRCIRYNHVAPLAPGKGRAGSDVRIQLDSTEAAVWCFDESENNMAIDDKTKTLIKLDGKDYEYGSVAHIEKLETTHTVSLDKARGELTSLKSQYDALQGKFDAAEVEGAKAKKEAEGAKAADGEKFVSRVKAKVRLLMRSLRLFGNPDDDNDEEDKEESKMDAIDELITLSDRDLMIRCLNKTEAFKEAKFDGKSDDYVAALFDNLKDPKPADGVDNVVRAHQKVAHSDSNDDAVVKAEIDRQRKAAETPPWKRPLQMTKS